MSYNGRQSVLNRKEYVAAARALLEFERGEAITIYDEAKIQNNLQALSESGPKVVHGDIVNNSHSFYVSNSEIRPSLTGIGDSQEALLSLESDVKREIIKSISGLEDGALTIVELYIAIRSAQELIDACLQSLIEQGLVKVANKESGSVCYIIDELFER